MADRAAELQVVKKDDLVLVHSSTSTGEVPLRRIAIRERPSFVETVVADAAIEPRTARTPATTGVTTGVTTGTAPAPAHDAQPQSTR